ncbi:MAG TPA: ferrochelatase [Solibacterales bacterium]|nr:ferrochelatase [Bryobacterales bacterium]
MPPDSPYDAVLVVSFGGPEGPDEVIPFLENVLRGRNVPRERMLAVAEHYRHFGGVSPINQQNRALVAALREELKAHGPDLPVYWGNRNWHPMLPATLAQMRADGLRRVLAFVTSAYSSYSGCRQYREDIERARVEIGEGAPMVDKLRVFYNHPGFIEPMVEHARAALAQFPAGSDVAVVYTAHSIPLAMANTSAYVQQLEETVRLVSKGLGRSGDPLVYQSRSGAPGQPWLEPDIGEWLRAQRPAQVVIVPSGFISDHMEVLYDLDTEARAICDELGLHMVRAATAGTHPRFVQMIRELILERIENPRRDICAPDCCPGRVR